MISISLVHRVPHELRLHRSGCSCTKSSRAAPMIRGRPSRNRNCNAYSCTPESGKVLTSLQGISSGDDNLPCGCTRRLSRSSHYTLTLFRIGCYPVRRFGIIITFLHPLAQQTALHRVVPLLAGLGTEYMTALTLHWPGVAFNNCWLCVATGHDVTQPQQFSRF